MTAKVKILLLIGLLFTLAIFVVSGIGFSNFKSASTDNNTNKIEEQAFLISKAVDQKMNRYFDALHIASDTIKVDETGVIDIRETKHLLGLLTKQLGVIDAYITTNQPKTYAYGFDGINPGFNAREKGREWFLRVMDGGEDNVITTPYTDSLGNAVMALAVPVKRNGKVIAVWWCYTGSWSRKKQQDKERCNQ